VGSTTDLELRMLYHTEKEFTNSFTAKYGDWEIYFKIETENTTVARKVETHIKKMKSRTYITNLKKYPEMSQKLLLKYSN
jgi:putative endonuclease